MTLLTGRAIASGHASSDHRVGLRISSLWEMSVYGHPIEQDRPLYFALWFLLLSVFFYLFSSPNLSRSRLDVYHTSTHCVVLVRISDAGLKRAARGSLKIQDAKSRQKIAIWAPSYNFVGLYLRN